MLHILEMAWFPIITMVFVVVMLAWALNRDSRRRRAVIVERPVVISQIDDDRLG